MKRLLTISIMTAALTLGVGAKDIKTVVFTTQPQMHCSGCEKKIKENVRFVKGVKQIDTNVERQTVTIQYDAEKTTPEKIQQGFKKIGYEATKVQPATPKKQTTKPQK